MADSGVIGVTEPILDLQGSDASSGQHGGGASRRTMPTKWRTMLAVSIASLLGVAIGVAALGAALEIRVTERLERLLPGVGSGQFADVVSTGNVDAAVASAPATLRPEVAPAARVAFVSGLDEVLPVAALVAFASAVLSLLLVRSSDLHREPVAAPEPEVAAA